MSLLFRLSSRPSIEGRAPPLFTAVTSAFVALCLLFGMASMGHSQSAVSDGISPILVQRAFVTLDPERLYAESAFGLRVQDELKALASEIQSENGKLTRDLEIEELDLLKQREILTSKEFRDLADAFDEKVQSIRDAQDRKGQELNDRAIDGQQAFNQASLPILQIIIKERNALGILDSRVILLPDPSIDITNEAILRVDQILKDGNP